MIHDDDTTEEQMRQIRELPEFKALTGLNRLENPTISLTEAGKEVLKAIQILNKKLESGVISTSPQGIREITEGIARLAAVLGATPRVTYQLPPHPNPPWVPLQPPGPTGTFTQQIGPTGPYVTINGDPR